MTKYTAAETACLNPLNIPSHVAIIPDGNRRWAKNLFLASEEGHRRGADIVTDVVVAAQELGIQAITIFTFSTENWKRPEWEIATLLFLLEEMLLRELSNLKEKGIRVKTIGDLTPFPERLLTVLDHVKEETKEGEGIDFILALNYGGRDELRRVFSKILDKIDSGEIDRAKIDEQLIAGHLDTAPFGDPDLIIRTSGEMRTSNFLLWQNSYSEWVLVDKLWPAFGPKDLLDSVITYQKRDRRKGGGQ